MRRGDMDASVPPENSYVREIVGASRLFYCLLRSKELTRFSEIMLAKFVFYRKTSI